MRVYLATILTLLTLPSALAQPQSQFGWAGWRTDWENTSIDVNELEVNVLRDGIAAIDTPSFVSIMEAEDWLEDQEPVVLIDFGGSSRAYPLQILTWHEIVNDRVGERPIAVTFCPLCYSAVAFERDLPAGEVEFGVSGMLRYSDLVMYDRQTHSLWQQLTGDAIVGEYAGTTLKRIPAQIISFAEFRKARPDGLVLSRETGYDRRYGSNPYVGYDNIEDRPWAFRGRPDSRLPPMQKVVGVSVGTDSRAYSHRTTRRAGVIHDRVGGADIVVLHSEKGATSALDRENIARSRVIGSTGVFFSDAGGRSLTFSRGSNGFVDDQTNSLWDVTGLAISGELSGTRLSPVGHVDVFAFAWFVMMPDTKLYQND
jgi:Protein of unknown function (DUF3179)